MEVKVSYSKVQLKLAVDYIAKYNVYFLNEHEKIEKTILEYIKILVHELYINCSTQEEFERLLKLKAFW
jgi:hypothetical protein